MRIPGLKLAHDIYVALSGKYFGSFHLNYGSDLVYLLMYMVELNGGSYEETSSLLLLTMDAINFNKKFAGIFTSLYL